jgi:hypothetical protein
MKFGLIILFLLIGSSIHHLPPGMITAYMGNDPTENYCNKEVPKNLPMFRIQLTQDGINYVLEGDKELLTGHDYYEYTQLNPKHNYKLGLHHLSSVAITKCHGEKTVLLSIYNKKKEVNEY